MPEFNPSDFGDITGPLSRVDSSLGDLVDAQIDRFGFPSTTFDIEHELGHSLLGRGFMDMEANPIDLPAPHNGNIYSEPLAEALQRPISEFISSGTVVAAPTAQQLREELAVFPQARLAEGHNALVSSAHIAQQEGGERTAQQVFRDHGYSAVDLAKNDNYHNFREAPINLDEMFSDGDLEKISQSATPRIEAILDGLQKAAKNLPENATPSQRREFFNQALRDLPADRIMGPISTISEPEVPTQKKQDVPANKQPMNVIAEATTSQPPSIEEVRAARAEFETNVNRVAAGIDDKSSYRAVSVEEAGAKITQKRYDKLLAEGRLGEKMAVYQTSPDKMKEIMQAASPNDIMQARQGGMSTGFIVRSTTREAVLEAPLNPPRPSALTAFSEATVPAESPKPISATAANLGESAIDAVTQEGADAIRDLSRAAKALSLAGRAAPAIAGVAVTGGASGMLYQAQEGQEALAGQLASEGKISVEGLNAYNELNQGYYKVMYGLNTADIAMDATGIGALPGSVGTAVAGIGLDISRGGEFKEWADTHAPTLSIKEYDALILGSSSMSAKAEMLEAAADNIPEDNPAFTEAIAARDAYEQAKVNVAANMNEFGGDDMPELQQDRDKAKIEMLTKMETLLENQATSGEMLGAIPEDAKLEYVARLSKSETSDGLLAEHHPEIAEFAAGAEKVSLREKVLGIDGQSGVTGDGSVHMDRYIQSRLGIQGGAAIIETEAGIPEVAQSVNMDEIKEKLGLGDSPADEWYAKQIENGTATIEQVINARGGGASKSEAPVENVQAIGSDFSSQNSTVSGNAAVLSEVVGVTPETPITVSPEIAQTVRTSALAAAGEGGSGGFDVSTASATDMGIAKLG